MRPVKKAFKPLRGIAALLSCLGLALLGIVGVKTQSAAAGSLFGIAISSGTPTLVSVDPSTGALTTVAAFPPGSRVAEGVSALDAATHRYFAYVEDSTSARHLVVTDTQMGTMASQSLTSPFASLEFDSATNTLFGVAIISGLPTLVSVDPGTGVLTPVASFPVGSRVAQGVSALDAATHRYFAYVEDSTSARHLVVTDTQMGATTSQSLASPFASLEFDSATDTLFGVAIISGLPTLVSIDPGTGALTTVVSFPAGSQVAQGVSALDSVTHRYFAYEEDFTFVRRLAAITTQGGAMADPSLAHPFASLEFEATVNNVAPTVTAGANQVANEGATVSLAPAATFTDANTADTHTATIDWGDGTPAQAGVVTEANGSGTVAGSHVYADNGIFIVTVTVLDNGGASNSASLTVTVNNVAPTVTAGANQVANEGATVNLAPATFTDAGTADTHIATINWGDGSALDAGAVAEAPFGPPGSTTPLSGSVAGSHIYADNGTYTVTVTVTDDDGGSGVGTLGVSVNNVAPTVNAGADQTVIQGGSVTFSGSFSDPGTGDTHTFSWNFGDGSPPVTGTLTPTHAYASSGIFTVTLAVTDDDGGVGTDTAIVTVLADTDGDGIPDILDPDDDNDGIADAIDRNKITGIDESLVVSNDFSDIALGGTTSGTITARGGWAVTVTDLNPGGVQVSLSGSGTLANISSCPAGGSERVELDGAGETAAITCVNTSGTNTGSTVTAINATSPPTKPRIVVRDSSGRVRASLPTGQTATIGSPVTASPDNTEPILVEVLDESGNVLGFLELPPGQTVDIEPNGPGGAVLVSNLSPEGSAPLTFTMDGQVITLSPGQRIADQCPGVAGNIAGTGCPAAIQNNVELHIVDQAKTGTCGTAGACKGPLSDVTLRVFDRNKLNGLGITTSDGANIVLTKNPHGSLYDDIFENAVTNAQAKVGACVTSSDGQCSAGEVVIGDFLVIAKYFDARTGKTVYTGKPLSPDDFKDTNGDGIRDLAVKDFQIMEVFKKDGSVEFAGGHKTVVTGSYLEIVHPDYAVWENGTSTFVYPFTFTSDSPWTADVCAQVPTGYRIVGAYDNDGNFLSDATCIQTFVAGDTKALAFEVIDVGSPEPHLKAKLRVKGGHANVEKTLELESPGIRKHHKRGNGAK